MKHLKILGLAVVAAAALMAFVGASTASATVLCSTNTNPCTGTKYPAGTTVSASLATGTKAVLSTEFQKIECSKSAVGGKTSNAGSGTETVSGAVETLTFEECNCEVSVLKKGTLEVHSVATNGNGTITSNGAEVTVECSTIFGKVHCIYVTENTNLGTVTGGSPAKVTASASIPRLTTNALCAAEANWKAEYSVSAPNPLWVEGS